MTEHEKILIAANMLYDAYGDEAKKRLWEWDADWEDQPEGSLFWSKVEHILLNQPWYVRMLKNCTKLPLMLY